MIFRKIILAWLFAIAPCFCALGGTKAEVLKVWSLLEDKQGRTALNPSLFERDAYQMKLIRNPKLCGGSKMVVQYKAPKSDSIRIKIELRTSDGVKTFEKGLVKSGLFGNWAEFEIGLDKEGKPIQSTAWRVRIVEGEAVLAEQRSFLW